MVWWWISLLECEEFGRMFDHSIPVRVFFLEEEISSRTLIPHLYPRISQSTVAQRAETTVSECFLTNCVSSFPDMFPHRLRWVKGVCAFRCNLPPALFGRMTVFFTCHCGNTRVERTPNKSQHTKLTLVKKILLPLLPGFELPTFRSRVWRSTNKLSRLPNLLKSQ